MLLSVDVQTIEPLADAVPFGAVGAYERLIGRAYGDVDPADPANAGIALIDKAPRNARGRVEYATDLFILRPQEPARGNGRILYEANNRGRKMLFGVADGPQGVYDPKTAADLGDGFPLRRGYTLVWSGWDPGAPRTPLSLTLDAPVATEAGRPIVQPIREQFVSGTRAGTLEVFHLSYEAASLDPAQVGVTMRERAADPPQLLPADAWSFVDAHTIRLRDAPRPGWLYDVRYPATNPQVMGLGFAATRDLVSWLRHDPAALAVTGRPVSHALAIGLSQSGRYLRDHIGRGFNRDEQGGRVFDGVLSHIAGVGRVFLDTPFGQPGRTCTQHQDHDFPENAFPFSTATLNDPLTGQTGSLLRGDGCDPLLIETNTSSEYTQKGASLLTTDPLGQRDVALPETTRVYLIAGTQHGGRAGAASDPGPAINPRNPHNPMPVVRALLVALDDWVVSGAPPPASRVPTLAHATLVAPDQIAFPAIPGAAVVRSANPIGPPGDWVDPQPPERAYRTLVCQVDGNGNEVAGVRLPDIAVPLATYTGWNEYRSPYPAGEIADRDGSRLPFAPDRASRLQTGDPRLSIAERYANRADYVAKVAAVVASLVAERLLLPEDAERYVERARQETQVPL